MANMLSLDTHLYYLQYTLLLNKPVFKRCFIHCNYL